MLKVPESFQILRTSIKKSTLPSTSSAAPKAAPKVTGMGPVEDMVGVTVP